MLNAGKAIQNEVRSKALALALRDIVYLLQWVREGFRQISAGFKLMFST